MSEDDLKDGADKKAPRQDSQDRWSEIRETIIHGSSPQRRIGFLPARQSHSRRNPMQDAVREVCVATDDGRVLRLLSNDLDASAQEIADLYKRRWAIELFFRWIKQTLRIRRFFGVGENAVRIQIAVALMAFLLLRLAQAATNSRIGPLAFARLVRVNLMLRRPLDRLLEPQQVSSHERAQLMLQWD